MFYLGGVGLAFFLTLLLVSKRKQTGADKILSVWLFLITTHLLFFYFWRMELYPQLLGIGIPYPLVHGPFLYLYTLALTNRSQSLSISLLHLIPFFAVLIYLIPFLALTVEQKLTVFKNNGEGYESFNLVLTIAIIISGVLYVTLSSLVLRKHRISIADQFSYTEKINLKWLQSLIYWIGVIWIMVIVGNDDLIFGLTVLFVLFIGFFGIRQAGIFQSPGISAASDLTETGMNTATEIENVSPGTPMLSGGEKRKYQKSGLSPEGSEILHRRLTQLMKIDKLYCESELSLTGLAGQLNTQTNYLSQVINELEGKTFYDYINTLRIDEFKRIAASPDNRRYTLLALAQHCGFSSKSSFNRYFKKVTGVSPSEFMQAVPYPEK